MRVAALDLGSNTSLLLVADVQGGVIERVLLDKNTVTKMGQGVHQKRQFHPDALQRLETCLAEYRKCIDEMKVDKIAAVATSAARDVSNQDALIRLGEKFSIPIEIISGDREARMTFWGAIGQKSSAEGVAVIDVGGGSTELIVGSKQGLSEISVNVGSVRLTDLFVTGHPLKTQELEAAIHYAAEKFAEARQRLAGLVVQKVIAVAGTPTTLAALEWNEPFSESKVDGFELSLTTIDKWIQTMAPLTIAEREKFKGLQPQRADVIVMGSVTLKAAMQALNCNKVTVSVRGIRYGLAMEMGQ